jgi:hypothetical protein
MRENRQSGLEGGSRSRRLLDPYQENRRTCIAVRDGGRCLKTFGAILRLGTNMPATRSLHFFVFFLVLFPSTRKSSDSEASD